MAEGFFGSTLITNRKAIPSEIPHCAACGMYRGCRTPKMPVSGEGRKGILIVGEAPGEFEDEDGIQFVGKTGQLLENEMDRASVDMRRDCWITNSVICRPVDKQRHNRTPTDKEIGYCRPNLIKTIRELNPTTILLLGKCAVQSLIGWLWRESIDSMGRWLGWTIPDRRLNAWICPLWHPSFISREEDNEVIRRIYREQLEKATSFTERPYLDPPDDLAAEVEVSLDDDWTAQWLRDCISLGEPISFDYETNMLKPDSPEAKIHSCAVCCGGKRTVAFPWRGRAIKAMGRLLNSKVPKIGFNQKFEKRWTLKEFGHEVRNWSYDSMLGTHVLDNRSHITSCKFQAYVRLGIAPWDDYVAPFLKSVRPGCNSPNRIFEANLKKVLIYCGIDALVEYMLGELQQKEIDDVGIR